MTRNVGAADSSAAFGAAGCEVESDGSPSDQYSSAGFLTADGSAALNNADDFTGAGAAGAGAAARGGVSALGCVSSGFFNHSAIRACSSADSAVSAAAGGCSTGFDSPCFTSA